MSIPNFPSTGLVPNVTTFQVGDILYMWDGEKWKSITAPLKADQITWKDGKTAGYALNDLDGFTAELLDQAGIVPKGQPDKLGASQRVDAIKKLIATKPTYNYYEQKLNEVVRKMQNGDTVKIVCLGDSITDFGYGHLYLQGMLREFHKNTNINVVSKGYSGETAAQIDGRWPVAVTAENPDLVLLMAGMNDAIQNLSVDGFVAPMYSMYARAVTENRAIVSMNITPINYIAGIDDAPPQKKINSYRRAGDDLALRLGVPHIDLNSALIDIMSDNCFDWADLMRDRVHPNDFGSREIAGFAMAKLLAGADLTVRVNSELYPTAANFVATDGAVLSYDVASTIPTVTCLKVQSTTQYGGLELWFWVEGYTGRCDIAIDCTRENLAAANKKPILFSNCDYINDPKSAWFFTNLGAASSPKPYRMQSVPTIATVVKPGINKISLLPFFNNSSANGVFEFSAIRINSRAIPKNEPFNSGSVPYSELSINDSTGIIKKLSEGRFVGIDDNYQVDDFGAGKRTSLHRLRFTLGQVFSLNMSRKNQRGAAYGSAFEVEFTKAGSDLLSAIYANETNGSRTLISTVTLLGQNTSGMLRLDILDTISASNVIGTTKIYIDGVLAGDFGCSIGMGGMVINGLATGVFTSEIYQCTGETNYLTPIEGEEWSNFYSGDRYIVINGIQRKFSPV